MAIYSRKKTNTAIIIVEDEKKIHTCITKTHPIYIIHTFIYYN